MHHEIKTARKNLGKWMRPRKHLSPVLIAPSRSAIHYQPLGQTLIIAPWNYPIQLALSPLVGSIAAGNVTVIKPSELGPRVLGRHRQDPGRDVRR